jgi:hypothetical protein
MDSTNKSNFPYDHVVIVVLENHGYDEIIGSPHAPYINNELVKNGVLINNAYGEQHPSQPNYFWLISGSNQGITYDTPYWNHEPRKHDHPAGPVFDTPNLFAALEEKVGPNSCIGYVDSGSDQPIQDYYSDTDNYANRHVPWLGFTNINDGKPYDEKVTKDFGTEFPFPTKDSPNPDYSSLPLLSFVIPGLNHDMHDYSDLGHGVYDPKSSKTAIQNGDAWLGYHLDSYAQWAKENNSLLIITFDEDSTADWPTPKKWDGNGIDGGTNPYGMTAPNLGFNDGSDPGNSLSGPNHIIMLFYGANLKNDIPNPYTVQGAGVNNVNLLRTIESFYNLPKSGAQTEAATKAGLTDGPITGIFTF